MGFFFYAEKLCVRRVAACVSGGGRVTDTKISIDVEKQRQNAPIAAFLLSRRESLLSSSRRKKSVVVVSYTRYNPMPFLVHSIQERDWVVVQVIHSLSLRRTNRGSSVVSALRSNAVPFSLYYDY